jgi:MFS family permease
MQTVAAQWLMITLEHSALMVALVQTAISLPVVLLALPAGALGDIVDRRRLLIASQVLALAAAALLAALTLAGEIGAWSLLGLTLAVGVGDSLRRPAWQALQPQLVPREQVPQAAVLNSANMNVARALGPALGGALSQISLAAPAYAAGTLSLLSALVGFFVLPESLPQERRASGTSRWREINPLGAVVAMARRPILGAVLLVLCLFYFAFNGYPIVLSVFAIERFNIQTFEIALVFVVGGVANAIVQSTLIGRLVPMFGEKALAMAGLALQALGFVAIIVAPSAWMLYPISIISSAGAGLIYPTLTALMANQVAPREQGQVAGVSTALSGLMSVFGPLWAGAAYDQLMPSAPFWSGAILLALAIVVLLGVRAARRTLAARVAMDTADRV